MTDRCVQSDFRSSGRRVVSFMVEWLSSWSSVLESVEWNSSESTNRWFLLEMSLGRAVWTGHDPTLGTWLHH